MEEFSLSSWLAEGGSSKLRTFSLNKSYSRISWVYTCVSEIARSIAGVPLLFKRGDELIEDKADPLLVLFNRPDPPLIPSFRELLLQTFVLLGIDGILFWVFKREKGVWTTVSIRKRSQMKPVMKEGSETELLGWVEIDKYKRPKATYGYKEVLPIRYYNPYDQLGGLAPLTAARLGIEQEFNMAAWNASFFANGLRNPIGLQFKRSLQPKQKKELKKNIRDYYSGIEGGQGVFLLEGDGEFADLHLSAAKDLDFVEGKQLTREEICAVYGVPPAVVGIFRYANYANCNVQRKLLWENCLLPKMMSLGDLIQVNVLDEEFIGVDGEWDLRSIKPLQKEFKSVAVAAKMYFDMGYTRAETAYILDVPELDPPKPEGEEPEEEPPPEEDQPTRPSIFLSAEQQAQLGLDVIQIKAPSEVLEEYGHAYGQVLTAFENRWLNYLEKYFTELGSALYRKAVRKQPVMLNPMAWEEPWEGMAEILIGDTCEFAARVTIAELNTRGYLEELVRVLQGALTKAGAAHLEAIDLASYFRASELEAFQTAITQYAAKTVGVSQEIISALNRRATQELLTGMTPNELRRAVKTIVAETYRGRSLTIARTISGGAYNSARFDSFQILEVQKHKWINAGDFNVRMSHVQEASSAPVIVGESFPVTGCRYPLDPNGKAKEVINCRCTTFPVKHKAPRRVRPARVPEVQATRPVVEAGRSQVMKNFFSKLKLENKKHLVKPNTRAFSRAQTSKLESMADEFLDKDSFKAIRYSEKELDDLVTKYGKKIGFTELTGVSEKGKKELRKILLAAVDKRIIEDPNLLRSVRIKPSSALTGGQYCRGQIELGTLRMKQVALFAERVAAGRVPTPDQLEALTFLTHEFGHHLDWCNKDITKWATALFKQRVKGEELKSWWGDRDVKVFRDKWASSYQGRVYKCEHFARGVEVPSMYNEVMALLPWTSEMQKILQLPRLRAAWARKILAKLVADPDGIEEFIKLVRGV